MQTAVLTCTLISCLCSIFGCIGLLLTYIKVIVVRNYIRKLLMFLTLANFVHVSAKLTGVIAKMSSSNDTSVTTNTTTLCKAQGVISAYAPMAMFLWSTVIAIYFHSHVLQTSCRETLASVPSSIVCHCICWIVPAIVCFVGLHYDVYGETTKLYMPLGCWIDTDDTRLSHKQQVLWMMLTKIGWECVTFLVVAEVAVYTAWRLVVLPLLHPRNNHPNCSAVFRDTRLQIHNGLRHADRNFLWAWLIFYGLRVWGVVRFFLLWASESQNVCEEADILVIVQAICDPGQAFIDFLLFCVFDKDVRGHFCGHNSRRQRVNELAETHPILRRSTSLPQSFL
ncbi:G-protein coupled receptor 157-like isoform X1 [Dreissena polymorpha]|uniref:G-protein coupled receptors family 2 profile 2 domain-containing protein n=1 Tax=Dreissena polymorpha TaxID=45954 RepID=A0A9D4ENU2_DREPO|nr:G-protein coupled receptor 157-like isoform X1 [Dreissena polymorpha]XP_052226992.1 G-protein coupled receptor 157-like isoform X1 [Dreissena polymorpha]KAH3783430.1 hypothetical protein DPMN_161368 [Dreissena polymorpha]